MRGNRYSSMEVFKLQLHDAIHRLRFYSNSLIHILSLSNPHNNLASIKKNRGDKSHRVIVALDRQLGMEPLVIDWAKGEAKMAKVVRNIQVYC